MVGVNGSSDYYEIFRDILYGMGCTRILQENTLFSGEYRLFRIQKDGCCEETVEAVLLKLSQSSEEEEARLRKIYDEELACQRRVNGDDILESDLF